MLPISQFVVKVHSRCDLACNHCYVYESEDSSWRGKPAVLSTATASRIAGRIAEHAIEHGLTYVQVVLHGGEPLLAGPARLDDIATTLRKQLPPDCHLDLRIHTNGVTLTDRFLDVFDRHRIGVGVSLDGHREANDLHRVYGNGRSSYEKVIRSINLLRSRKHLYSGLLCTIDVASDPIKVYHALLDQAPPRVDFLLPHATWDAPSPRPTPTAYADWLIAIYDQWERDNRPMAVRLFDSVIRTLNGQSSLTEAIGLDPSSLMVIETDGSYEQVDSMKVTFEGAPATGQDVFQHSVDEAASHPGILARQSGLAGLSAACQKCELVTSCGGGLYPHRFRAGSFVNPSVYCTDLFKLISHIRDAGSMQHHVLSLSSFNTVAAGFGDLGDIRQLAEAQHSLRRVLISGFSNHDAWPLLVDLDNRRPEAATRVLTHPYIREWAIQARKGDADASYLGNITAAIAVVAGLAGTFRVAVHDGDAHLPTVGTIGGLTGDSATVTVEGGRVEASDGFTWRPVRRLTSGDFSVLVDDGDPFRDCYGLPVTGRLTTDEMIAWQATFHAAWAVIESEFPEYVPGLRAGLSTITPLAADAGGDDVSCTARNAFGALGTALPASPETLALLIIHEFQHVKLGAVLDLVDLFDPEDKQLFYAPWRPDPRPLEGLFQGTYAHIAVVDFWRRRRKVTGALPDHAHFARWRDQTASALETLLTSGALTDLGLRFVRRMKETVTEWSSEEVPPEAGAAADATTRAHLEAFQTQGG
ncbi:FxsB family cyclophane-forming radical SAM/SPASM peptide maturase [Herbidospora mongoliensis]|uniref:FxsB family cyclophane-forming radical SAM/SPASM peptide maturase n=1 Tax=Herbidospora mongoliensis TaxID=688067 RepID=UPI000B0DF46C|nr:FxsB family cyclophane-forming radical SAM/SPASM peptide maturase [Herbidospora mongoliensis]